MDEKTFILSKIREVAAEGNKPPGSRSFESLTGIRQSDWRGRYWARWSDALVEAGLAPNQMNLPMSSEEVLNALAAIARQLGHFPTLSEIQLARRSDVAVPSWHVFKRIGSQEVLREKLISYCRMHDDLADVLSICEGTSRDIPDTDREVGRNSTNLGEVYMVKSGRYYKIGFSVSSGRRLREFEIQLPDAPKRIHTILTDDPRGIEAYWHKRFDAKRVRPGAEFFRLDNEDVRAFRAWKKIV